jgi:hypothetical protein
VIDLLKYLELILSVVSVLILSTVSWIFFHAHSARWEAAGVITAAAALIHGSIFYLIRRRQNRLRQITIRQMQVVADDIVRNQMTVVSLSAGLPPDAPPSVQQREWAQRSIEAAHEIARRLNDIDSDRLSELIRRRPRAG